MENNVDAIGKQLEEGFDLASKKLRELAVEMGKAYEEHKDEIDAEVERYRREREKLQASMPKIKLGDIVRIDTVHSAELKCYEVDSIKFDGVVSQPAGFHHNYNEIVAVYRFDGTDFKCIWEREDYKESKVK